MTQESEAAAQRQESHGNEIDHPTPLTYFKVAMTLSAITAFEVLVFYANFVRHAIIGILVVLSTAKFILVAMYYMHLKFESRIFSILFVAGLVLAGLMIFTLMGLLEFFLQRT